MALLKEKHPQPDLFIPDMFDNIGASFKDDMASMEHPIFTLSKKTDMRCLEYQKENVKISITPSVLGLPTIFDKDVLLYCASLLMTEINAGRTPPKTLRISCHDLLVVTNRLTNGLAYTRLQSALKRLRGVTITTNIKTNKREVIKGFGLIESYEIIESSKVKNRMVRLEITLSDWFYNSIIGKEVLTINRDYFLLSKPIERRLYEIARKHCGKSPQWEIGLIKLMDKVGSSSTLRLFRSRLKEIAQDNHLPDYRFTLDENDKVIFKRKDVIATKEKKEISSSFNLPSHMEQEAVFKKLKHKTLITAVKLMEDNQCSISLESLIFQFIAYVLKTGEPKNYDAAFIGFIKKKIKDTT